MFVQNTEGAGQKVDRFINEYKEYLFGEQKASVNTIQAYVRDIRLYDKFLIVSQTDIYKANKTNVLSYILHMQKQNKAPEICIHFLC